MRQVEVIKKADVLQRLDDPKRDDIKRRLGEIRAEIPKLKRMIEERPSRADLILSTFDALRLELETSASSR